MDNLSDATREIMWNIQLAWLMYLLFAAAVVMLVFGLYQRINSWKKGKQDDERLSDLPGRFVFMLKEMLLQRKTLQSGFPALFHSLIFYSFLILVVTTGVVALDYDLGTSFFAGHIYVYLSAASEIAGILILLGVFMAMWRRYISKPSTIETVFADTWALLLLALIIITGFAAEGARISAAGDKWSAISPAGCVMSFLFAGFDGKSGAVIHRILWWLHAGLAFFWIGAIPYTKFFHVLLLPANAFFSKMKPAGELQRVDIEAMMEDDDFDEEDFNIGIDTAKDFTWKHRMDFDACVSCGRCEEVCPSFLANQPLSPKQFIADLKEMAIESGNKNSSEEPKEIVGSVFDEDYIWYCRTCMACTQVCPAYITHVDTLVEIRRNEVNMKGRVPADAGQNLKGMETRGNPFGSQIDRVDWIETLDVPVLGEGDGCDVLYWIGCLTTFDEAKQAIAADLIKILKKCGTDFGVMGKGETCCGDPARVCGDENLFQSTAKMQVEELNSRKFNKILVSCPHCYNVLKNEYPQFGGNYKVIHHSEFLQDMVQAGKLKANRPGTERAVYHDPCYLGRYQKIYDNPRQVIEGATGSAPLEMGNCREKSLCCGGGGGHFWMDFKEGERINNLRIQQAHETGADTVITSCPFCLQMLDDSIKIMNLDEQLKIKDIVSLFADSE